MFGNKCFILSACIYFESFIKCLLHTEVHIHWGYATQANWAFHKLKAQVYANQLNFRKSANRLIFKDKTLQAKVHQHHFFEYIWSTLWTRLSAFLHKVWMSHKLLLQSELGAILVCPEIKLSEQNVDRFTLKLTWCIICRKPSTHCVCLVCNECIYSWSVFTGSEQQKILT